MFQRINMRTLSQLFLISALSAVLIVTGGCDFISNIFSKSDKAVENTYIEYRRAFMAGDIETLKKLISKDKAYELEDKQASAKLELARALYPTDITITGIYIEGNAAILTASADGHDGKMQGTIHLLKEDGRWKVYEENWETKIGMTESSQTMPPSQTTDRNDT
jgi:hypothetical protein